MKNHWLDKRTDRLAYEGYLRDRYSGENETPDDLWEDVWQAQSRWDADYPDCRTLNERIKEKYESQYVHTPFGRSRGLAHQLRLMADATDIHHLVRTPGQSPARRRSSRRR
jgi:hypothetical protein